MKISNVVIGLSCFLCSVIVPLSSLAQDNHKNAVRLGFHTSNLTDAGDDLLDRNLSGFFVGYFREMNVTLLMRFSTGLEYYENGSKANSDTKVRLGYLSVPVSLKIALGPVRVGGGISGAVRISAKESMNGQDIEVPDDKYKRLDMTGFVCANFKILFIGLDLRYHWGILNVVEEYSSHFFQIGANLYF